MVFSKAQRAELIKKPIALIKRASDKNWVKFVAIGVGIAVAVVTFYVLAW